MASEPQPLPQLPQLLNTWPVGPWGAMGPLMIINSTSMVPRFTITVIRPLLNIVLWPLLALLCPGPRADQAPLRELWVEAGVTITAAAATESKSAEGRHTCPKCSSFMISHCLQDGSGNSSAVNTASRLVDGTSTSTVHVGSNLPLRRSSKPSLRRTSSTTTLKSLTLPLTGGTPTTVAAVADLPAVVPTVRAAQRHPQDPVAVGLQHLQQVVTTLLAVLAVKAPILAAVQPHYTIILPLTIMHFIPPSHPPPPLPPPTCRRA